MSPYLPSSRTNKTCNIMMESLGDLNITKEQQNIHSLYNQNETWLSEKGAWLTYFILVVFLHLVLLSIPFFDTATAWTMTNVIHNVVIICKQILVEQQILSGISSRFAKEYICRFFMRSRMAL